MTRFAPRALIVLLSALSFAARAQTPTFSSRVEQVRVDVLVTDKGKPVRGLRTEDFEIVDNGVVQHVDLASFEEIPLNVIVALDMSESVAGERLDHLRSAGHALLDGLKKDDQAAAITFSHIVVGSSLTKELDRVRATLDAVQSSGRTSIIDACYAGIMVAESDAGRALLIVFSDGIDVSSWLSQDAVLDIARRSDAVVYGVSVGKTPRGAFLRELSALTGGTLFEVESTKNVGSTFVGILEEFRQRYLISYAPKGVSREGWHKLDVRVKGRGATVKARPGYLAGNTPSP